MDDARTTPMTPLQARIFERLEAAGPLLGKELAEAIPDAGYLDLWQACFTAPDLQISHFARYYLRFDVTREDMIRLSPSILRDFLSFTLFSLSGQRGDVIDRQVILSNAHREISLWKIGIARSILVEVMKRIRLEERDRICAFIAGDLVYFLGHSEPREVEALGRFVRGSDIDIVIVHDGLSEDVVGRIDDAMLQHKSYYLSHPDYVQEVDYVCKSLDKLTSQFAYETIREKIASKIAYEAMFLAGSVTLYDEIKRRMADIGVNGRIEQDFETGLEDRRNAMRQLLSADPSRIDENVNSLFYFSQERVEFD